MNRLRICGRGFLRGASRRPGRGDRIALVVLGHRGLGWGLVLGGPGWVGICRVVVMVGGSLRRLIRGVGLVEGEGRRYYILES